VFLLGTVQMLFESVVFVFIFLWTPLLQPHGAPLGIVFAAFMAASALGSSLYRLLVSASLLQPSHLLLLAVLLLFLAFLALLFATQPVQAFGAFLFVEFSCGLYFPAMGFLRRKIVPQKDRAGVTNWFHLPLNLLVWLVLLGWTPTHGASDMGSACALLALLALLVATCLFALIRRDAELRCPTDAAVSDL
ncbi:molybdate-anion transporter, partial [Falco rusticolus]|uniref:molybdate-anion transporter n=1 Tax=Falco rusticolus TaxID=120794 RepID=UPI0018867D4A